MSRETTSFVYVTYIASTPEKVFEAVTGLARHCSQTWSMACLSGPGKL